MNQNEINVHKIIKQTLIDQFKQQWHAQLQSSNKQMNYSRFKENHEFEHYIKSLNKDEHLPLLRFRTANHHLTIELGRYDGTPLNDTTCNLCNLGKAGSEKHYVLECPFFSKMQNSCIWQILTNIVLMSTHSDKKLKSLGKFVSFTMETFQDNAHICLQI